MVRRITAFLTVVTAAASVSAAAATGDVLYARPGASYSTGTGSLNLYCTGSGQPAVVFDSGWGDWSPAWAVLQPKVAAFARACSYDRAGYGCSRAGPLPRTSVRSADELHAALHNAGIAPPYVLVGAAFGSYSVRAFADRYTNEVAGVVLSDADDGDVEPAKWQARDLRSIPRLVARMRACRNAIAKSSALPAFCPRLFYRGLPERTFSSDLSAALLQQIRTQTKPYDAAISEMEAMPSDWKYLQENVASLGSRPVRVLTTWHFGRPPAKPAAEHRWHVEFERDTARAQASWLRLSTNARQIFDYDESQNYIQLDRPWVVLNVIRDVVRTVAFADCTVCPDMVAVPSGSFTMGSPAVEKAWAAVHGATAQAVADEAPQHTVTLRGFAIGKYPVTGDEFAAFVRETGYAAEDGCGVNSFHWTLQAGLNWKNPGFTQSGRNPVVCVSWNDARAYVAYLNRKIGSASNESPYRLPSESEWEYAVRAGSTTPFWWGNDERDAAAHAWYEANSNGSTHPVGMKPPNAFGLYDAAGNVWEWTADCYAESYANAPVDGSSYETGKECLRVDRGGSWLLPAWLLRSATRERNPATFRDAIMGFRVAKSI